MAREQVQLYVDNSNLFIEGKRLARMKGEDPERFRLNFEHFVRSLIRGRVLRAVTWGGSIPPEDDVVWTHLAALGIKPHLLERGPSGENETVDSKIQLDMYRHVWEWSQSPGTIILATGDGKGYYNKEGFLFDVERFVNAGWTVEVCSWSHCCHGQLRKFAEQNGIFLPLDKIYESITFTQNGRRSMKVDNDAILDLVDPIR